MSNVFYIPGFGSGPDSSTFLELKKLIPEIKILSYDFKNPAASLDDLTAYLSTLDDVIIVASSLGGWYAEEISKCVICDLVLYNPATMPWVTLSRYGVDSDVLSKYADIANEELNSVLPNRRHVILCTDDEIIDCSAAKNKYSLNASITFMTGGHRSTTESIALMAKKVEYLHNTF